MDKKLKSALKPSFTPPPTHQKEQFLSSISYPKENFIQMFISQIGYIRKRIWFLSAMLPLFLLCTITELYKSRAYSMDELELVCKYNLSKITLVRLVILGIANSIILILLVIIVGKSGFGILHNSVYISMPYLFSSYLSLLIISKLNAKETIYVCAAVSGAVSIFTMIASSSCQFIYNADFAFIWEIVCVMLIGFIFYSLIRYTKLQEELQWSLL